MPETKDQYVNQAYLTVTESAANTLTFNQLLTSISIHEKIGWIIARMEYQVVVNETDWNADQDFISFGISTSDKISSASLQDDPVVDFNRINRVDIGVAASGSFVRTPFMKDFSSLPGGGILVPPNPLFIFAKGSGLVGAQTINARMFYTVKQLKTEDFWELVEMRRMIGS